jgi:hypothetical protein
MILNPLDSELIINTEAVKFYTAKDSVQFDRIHPENDDPALIE